VRNVLLAIIVVAATCLAAPVSSDPYLEPCGEQGPSTTTNLTRHIREIHSNAIEIEYQAEKFMNFTLVRLA
jgi:hypothetical protein